jgi:hypothetical protein
MQKMIKSQVIDWLLNNDERGCVKDMHDFAYGSHTVTTKIVKMVIGEILFELMIYEVPIYNESDEALNDYAVSEPKLYTREEVKRLISRAFSSDLVNTQSASQLDVWLEQNVK